MPPPSAPPPQPPVDQGPAPGWYQDPTGTGLRWWDGSAWTGHLHDPASPAAVDSPSATSTPTASPTSPSSAKPSAVGKFADENRRLIVLLGILVAALIAALVLSMGGDDTAEPTGGPAAPAERSADDLEAQSSALTAQTALETYATDRNGNYAKATPEQLVEIEQTLEGSTLTVAAERTSYSVSATSTVTGNVFTITREGTGDISRTCTAAGTGECPATGAWE